MNRHVLGYILILFGILKIITSVLNEIAPDNLRRQLQEISVLGHIFEDNDTTIARQVFNLCFLIYGVDSLLHGLYLKRWFIDSPMWIITHEGTYILHMILGLFMFILFYSLLNVNKSFYVIEGIYTGIILLMIVPIMYWYNKKHDHKIMNIVETISCTVSIVFLLYIGYTIMIANPDRVPNLLDMSMITLNSLV